MDLEIAGKVAVVTDGESGIGAATVKLLTQEGVRVAVWDLQSTDTSEAEQVNAADVTNLSQVEMAWRKTEERPGAVDILVHAAAVGSGHFGFPYTPRAGFVVGQGLQVNIPGMVYVAHVAGAAMQKRGAGAIVFLSSVAGQMGSQTDPPYSASKAANLNFAQCMAKARWSLAQFHACTLRAFCSKRTT